MPASGGAQNCRSSLPETCPEGLPTVSPEIQFAIDYIKANLELGVSNQRLADLLDRSTGSLVRRFRQETGQTPHQYLICARLSLAQELLAKTEMPIIHVALECGFTHQEHLNRYFKRHVLTTPAAFRRHARYGPQAGLAELPTTG
jgi:AraC family transcriptional regulator